MNAACAVTTFVETVCGLIETGLTCRHIVIDIVPLRTPAYAVGSSY
jgi:hypothetical protein